MPIPRHLTPDSCSVLTRSFKKKLTKKTETRLVDQKLVEMLQNALRLLRSLLTAAKSVGESNIR